ncbi:PTH2 family peptidyl-tRNA hydrolase [Moesziomyces antarcticus]|uniref:peptidyl-tRNA hydrolase n=1 Tax=Pseudozyma antarctica TaxID=84753 RepID=A0A5C3FJI8_PSEA2|nr:PTH2 family peptidyl-tRNA hydrolase [Moesziomyces antarcticus]GAK63719.1 PTH2 family peptidyl-tRNA hydrolase [Moesziomyces antarcticus]SPO44316.1 related to PTH2 - aminoacyl-tRNA hydrolase [Moesziomyces antarcticus]
MSISTSASGAMLPTLVAVSIASLTIGYFAGMGRSLVSYNANSRRILQDDDSSDDDDLDDANVSSTEECKMILAVRMDLKMEKGKIAAQCGHATLAVYKLARRITPAFVKQWETLGQAKVAVKCPDEPTMLELESKAKELGIAARSIIDAGRTQIAPNSRTVLGLGPAPVSLMNQLTGHLKLL